MFKAVLRIQWRACWHLLALTVAALALPIVSVQLGWHGAHNNLPFFLVELQLWGFFYPGLAAVIAFVVAAAIWYSDRRGQHVYALLLPLPRWRYVLLRYGAGLVLLLPIVTALWIGSTIAAHSLDLPPGLRTYPNALALKFAIVVVLMYGIAFAFAASSGRAVGIALRILGLFIAVHIAVQLISPNTNLVMLALNALATFPGPLAPMGGRWMLIDA